MSLPREPFSWDGDDVPVPLDDAGLDFPGCGGAEDVLVVAESVVNDAQDAIARQDTDPTLTLPEPDLTEPAYESPSSVPRSRPRFPRALKATLLAVGCALAFVHGWSVGAPAEAGEPASTCDAHHCSQSRER